MLIGSFIAFLTGRSDYFCVASASIPLGGSAQRVSKRVDITSPLLSRVGTRASRNRRGRQAPELALDLGRNLVPQRARLGWRRSEWIFALKERARPTKRPIYR